MSNVDNTPFNLVPKDWAFDPEIGPFIEELLDVIWQLRLRTGGDIDRVASSITEVEAVSVSSSDSLYSHIGTVDNEQAFVAGYYVAGDGGGGTFYWDASSTAADDAAITILPTAHSGAGRWIRIYSRDSNVRWFGAKGDGVTNNDTALTTAVAHGEPIYVPPSTSNYITTNTNPNLVGKWVGDGQIEESGVLTHAPNFIIADTEPSPRTTPAEAAVAVTAFTGDLSKAFQPVEVRVLGADTLGNPVSEPALQTGFYFCEELFPYYTHIVNQAGFNYAHDAPEGRSSMSAIRIVGTHTGGGGILPISTSTWASGNRGASEAASYGDGLATTTFLANPAASGANFSANAGADAVYLNPLEVNCVDNPSGSSPKDVAAIGFVANMIRDHDRTSVPLDCVWQGIRVQSVGDYPIDTVFTSSGPGGATTFIDATLINLDANGELLLMKDGHRIYGNATFNSGTNRWKRATAGTDWIGYNSAVTGWQIFTGNTERLRLSTAGVNMPGLPVFPNEAAAASLATGDLYQTATGELRIKL